jgi:hypothetical protein
MEVSPFILEPFQSVIQALQNSSCLIFQACLLLQQLKLVMDSIVWAFRHTERNVAETGLNLLLEMLGNFQVCYFNMVSKMLQTRADKPLTEALCGKAVGI